MPTNDIYTLSLHDALPILETAVALNDETDLMALRKSIIKWCQLLLKNRSMALIAIIDLLKHAKNKRLQLLRSEEHTSELQSRFDLVCRLLLEKKNKSIRLY